MDDKASIKARLLVVDDDHLILAALAEGLRKGGYEVAAMDSGEAALAAAAEASFDLAILDICMPGLSGIEVALQLRERHGLHALFLTACSDDEVVEQAVREGAVGYLVKPLDLRQLGPAVEAALARVRDLEALQKSREQLEQALNAGRATSVAIGLMMERLRLNHDAAFQALRQEARKERRRLEDLAQEVVAAAEILNRLGGAGR